MAAVADGAGSAPLSEIGARTAAETAVQSASSAITSLPEFEEQQGRKLLSYAFEAARASVEEAAAAQNRPAAELAWSLIAGNAGAPR